MSDPAAISALPGLLRAARELVERDAPGGPLSSLRWTLLGLLLGAEVTAEQIVALAPMAALMDPPEHPGPRQFHAPLGDRSPVVEEPRVPRFGSRDSRLPGKRPHP